MAEQQKKKIQQTNEKQLERCMFYYFASTHDDAEPQIYCINLVKPKITGSFAVTIYNQPTQREKNNI